MPSAAFPDRTFPIVLDCDKYCEYDSRPTFYSYSLTMREQNSVFAVLDRLHEAGSEDTQKTIFETTCIKLAEVIAGWKNIRDRKGNAIEFVAHDAEIWQDVLGYIEARELLKKVAYNIALDDTQKKD